MSRSAVVLDVASVDAPQIDRAVRDVGVQLRAGVRRPDATEVDAKHLPQTLSVVSGQALVSLESPVYAGIG